MPSWKAMLAFTLTTSALIVGGESMFPYSGARLVSPIVQGVALTGGFLILWPTWVQHQPDRRARSFTGYAAAIIVAMALLTVFRLAIGLGYIERIAVRFVLLIFV